MANGSSTNGLTNQQIVDLLNDDVEFGINFIIDNNPSAVESNISALSLPLPQNPSVLQLREVIDELIETSPENENAQDDIEFILFVPYIDTANNYTGGFASYLSSISPPPQPNQKVILAIASALGGVFQGVASLISSKRALKMQEIQAEMQKDQIRFELEKIERTRVLGIPQAVFIAVLGFLMFMVLILFLTKPKR
tara:strand:+ start:22 stop:609 length:588 start_codon:yes stop_codon:yes gene_type:complete